MCGEQSQRLFRLRSQNGDKEDAGKEGERDTKNCVHGRVVGTKKYRKVSCKVQLMGQCKQEGSGIRAKGLLLCHSTASVRLWRQRWRCCVDED